jgi:hypothetical protein
MWYHSLNGFPGILCDRNGYLTFNNEKNYQNHSQLQHGSTLHVESGISSIAGYVLFSSSEKQKLGI